MSNKIKIACYRSILNPVSIPNWHISNTQNQTANEFICLEINLTQHFDNNNWRKKHTQISNERNGLYHATFELNFCKRAPPHFVWRCNEKWSVIQATLWLFLLIFAHFFLSFGMTNSSGAQLQMNRLLSTTRYNNQTRAVYDIHLQWNFCHLFGAFV